LARIGIPHVDHDREDFLDCQLKQSRLGAKGGNGGLDRLSERDSAYFA
jgi:hypothetical protein